MVSKLCVVFAGFICVLDLLWNINPYSYVYLSCVLAGVWVVLSWLNGRLPMYHVSSSRPKAGISSVLEVCSLDPENRKLDSRITGSVDIDSQLQKALKYISRDYVESWYFKHIGLDEAFITQTNKTAQTALRKFAVQCKKADWVSLLTLQLVDDLIQHFKLYKQSLDKVREKASGGNPEVENGDLEELAREDLQNEFFSLEATLPSSQVMGRLCQNEQMEKEYLDIISEMIIYYILPPEDFHNHPLKCLLRDVVACNVLQPLVNSLCEPDSVNQYFILFLKESNLNAESFQAAIRMCSSLDELKELERFTEEEVAGMQRTGSSNEDHQQLSSAQFILQLCQKSIEKLLNTSESTSPVPPPEDGEGQRKQDLPFSLKAEIPDCYFHEGDGDGEGDHVRYCIHVTCKHGVGKEEEWLAQRSFEDFKRLHTIVESQIGPGIVTTPKLRDANSKDSLKQDLNCRTLEQYLCKLLLPDLLIEFPELLGTLVQFCVSQNFSLANSSDSSPPLHRTRSDSGSRRNDATYSSSPPKQKSLTALDPKKEHLEKVKKSVSQSKHSPLMKQTIVKGTKPEDILSSTEERVTSLTFDESDDSVPLRILMMLADVVFDLKNQNQWFRRSVTITVQEVVRATFGDRLSCKIVEQVDKLTEPEQVADYLSQIINSVWPEGSPFQPKSSRDAPVMLRTRMIARAKLLGSIPDDLRRIIGTNTTHTGMSKVFDMFQIRLLNKRLVYCMLEQFLLTLFKENQTKLVELFKQLHTQ